MLRAHRLPVVRLCLLLLAAVLCGASVLALAASADPSRAAAASLPTTGVSVPSISKAKKASKRRSPSARRAECASAARTEKARKACAVEKAKAKGSKPSASPKAGVRCPLDALPCPRSPALPRWKRLR